FFISPSCPACAQVARAIQALPDLPGLDQLAICQSSPEAARRYAERKQLDLPVLPDPDGVAMSALQVTGIPFALVLDPRGRVARKGVPATYRDLLDLLDVSSEAPAEEAPRLELAAAAGGR